MKILEDSWKNCDFACYPESNVNFNSSVTFWADSEKARELLNEWRTRSSQDQSLWPATHRFSPQHHLADAWLSLSECGRAPLTTWLPKGYFHRYDDEPVGEIVVEHSQASREMRAYLNQRKSNVLVKSAFQQFKSENASEARHLCRQALEIDPDNFDARQLFRLITHKIGNNDFKPKVIGKVLTDDASPAAINGLGQAYHSHSQLEEAECCFREAIALKPDYVMAYNNLGLVLQESGRTAEAEQAYLQALGIKPDFAEVYCNLGNVLRDLGRLEEAERACRQALAINPGIAAAHNIFGNVLLSLGRLEEAEHAFQEALKIRPDYAKASNNLGTVLHLLGKLAEAEQAYRQALTIDPEMAMAYNNLGAVLRDFSRLEESQETLRHALSLMPGHSEIHNNLAITLKELGRLEEAKGTCIAALKINPGASKILNNLGVISKELGLFEEAAEAFRQALSISPGSGDAHWNLALLNLQRGDFEIGWEKYESRFCTRKDPHGKLRVPRYDGSNLIGKTVFVYSEQAVGEELMFSSCLSNICSQASQCILECDPRLLPLFSRSFPNITVIPATGVDNHNLSPDLPPHIDFKVPLGSLPFHYRNSRDDFKRCGSWIIPCQRAVQKWQKRYEALGKGLKIGIAWRGGVKKEFSRMRSTNLLQWRNIFSIPGLHFVNLQYGDCSKEIRDIQEQCGTLIHSWEDSDQIRDLDDFAAQAVALDLIISIDNTTVHMAGAVGRPVWCLLPHVPNWRWMLDCEDSPWYPTMRLFRQKKQHDWDPVFNAVAGDLNRLVNHRSSSIDG